MVFIRSSIIPRKFIQNFWRGSPGFNFSLASKNLLYVVWEILCSQNVAKLMSFKFECTQSSSSFVDTITSNTFLVIASYANLYNRIPLLYIFLIRPCPLNPLQQHHFESAHHVIQLLKIVCWGYAWTFLFFLPFYFNCFRINDLVECTNYWW